MKNFSIREQSSDLNPFAFMVPSGDALGVWPVFKKSQDKETYHGVFIVEATTLSPADYSQAYFWTDAWQRGERQADEDIRLGRTRRFSDLQAAFSWLDEEAD